MINLFRFLDLKRKKIFLLCVDVATDVAQEKICHHMVVYVHATWRTTYVCACMCASVRVYAHVCAYVCTCVRVCACMCTYVQMCVFMCECKY